MALLTDPHRKHRAGIAVTFRLQDDLETELWKARMESIPREDERVGLIVDGEIPTMYKVESVKWEFLYDSLDIQGQTQSANYAYTGVAIIVSEV